MAKLGALSKEWMHKMRPEDLLRENCQAEGMVSSRVLKLEE